MTGCGCGGACGGGCGGSPPGGGAVGAAVCGCDPLVACGCCEGIHVVTPVAIYNRPGLAELAYRVGTHGRFLATLLARLSSRDHPVLHALRTRDRDDFSIALLDGWATVADVLTFYQERIANEGFLRTATERRSVLELARLIGYAPRPGLSATAYVAYTVEAGHVLTIPAGSKVQSVPGHQELPQTFETFEPLFALGELSAVSPRRTRPQSLPGSGLPTMTQLVVAGTVPDVKPGAVVRAQVSGATALLEVTKATPDTVRGTTTVAVAFRGSFGAALPAPPPQPPAVPTIAQLQAELPATAATAGVSAAAARPTLDLVATLTKGGAANDHVVAQLRDLYSSASTAGDSPLSNWLAMIVERSAASVAADKAKGGASTIGVSVSENGPTRLAQLVSVLRKPGSIPPATERALSRDRAALFATQSGVVGRLFGVLVPEVKDLIGPALANTAEPDHTPVAFDRMAVNAALFGDQAYLFPKYSEGIVKGFVDPLVTQLPVASADNGDDPNAIPAQFDPPTYVPSTDLLLNREHDGIHIGQDVVLRNPMLSVPVTSRAVKAVEAVSVSALGLSGRVTKLVLDKAWPDKDAAGRDPSLRDVVRHTQVLASPQPLVLAEESMDDEDVGREPTPDVLELDALYPDLAPGRFVAVTGERADPDLQKMQGPAEATKGSGVQGAELVMIASVEHRVARLADGANRPGDTVHTFLHLARPLAFQYRRPTVAIHANVVKATHGATTKEVLGAGDATKRLQRFPLKQPPLTYLPAPNAAGAQSTLEVRVNDVLWHEAEDLLGTGPNDRRYVIRTEDDGQTAIVFGDGERGARLPTGLENVRARYRSGLGMAGNVRATAISIAVDRPLGVKEVVNPLDATGGADRESRDQARRNAPIAVQALDRLVSVQDYTDFARAFAGIGAASAVELSDGRRQLVHVTIAGVGDSPIAPSSDLCRNLRQALVDLGDPFEPLELAVRTLRALVIEAGVRIDPDNEWDSVEPALRSALLAAFAAERRDLGQDVVESEVLATMQAVPGVEYVQLRVLDTLGEDRLSLANPAAGLAFRPRVPARLAERRPAPAGAPGSPGAVRGIAPAELVILTPAVPETLILSELR